VSFGAAAVGERVVVAWETGPEAGLAGFHVLRARAAEGPWTRVNAALIPARGGAASGLRYSLTDRPGAGSYRYRLDVVEENGTTSPVGPVEVTVAAGVAPGGVYLPWVAR
jgi:hypothetical protein